MIIGWVKWLCPSFFLPFVRWLADDSEAIDGTYVHLSHPLESPDNTLTFAKTLANFLGFSEH